MRQTVKLRYDWPFGDIPSVCAYGEKFTVDHAMICKRGGFVIQRHNELRDLVADLLSMFCNDVEVEPVLQGMTEEQLMRGSNRAGLDQDQGAQQIYRIHENEKRRLCSRGVFDVEHGSFTPLVLQLLEGWGRNAKDTIMHWLSW